MSDPAPVKSMDSLSMVVRIGPNSWSASYYRGSTSASKDPIFHISGNCKIVTKVEIDSSEFASGDIQELIAEVNDCFAARGVGYRIGQQLPTMVKV